MCVSACVFTYQHFWVGEQIFHIIRWQGQDQNQGRHSPSELSRELFRLFPSRYPATVLDIRSECHSNSSHAIFINLISVAVSCLAQSMRALSLLHSLCGLS